VFGGFAYFNMELGLSKALSIYFGGLGILAGNHSKAISYQYQGLLFRSIKLLLLPTRSFFVGSIYDSSKCLELSRRIAIFPHNEVRIREPQQK
jgi:hypothetical protein